MEDERNEGLSVKTAFLLLAWFFIGGIVFLITLYNALALPQVAISNETKKCAFVISNNPKHSCYNKPDKYSMIWVK